MREPGRRYGMRSRWIGSLLFVALVVTLGGASGTVSMEDAVGAPAAAMVVAHKDFPATGLTRVDLKNMFLGKKTKLDGKSVVIATLRAGPTHTTFLKTWVAKTPSQFKNYWRKQVFTGKSRAPRAFKSEKDLLAFVRKTPGAIGYVSAGTRTDGARVLTIE
jgi:ABC-type phosphate transport system substrate-binding protein